VLQKIEPAGRVTEALVGTGAVRSIWRW